MKMKQIVTMCVTTLLLAAAMCVGASASSYDAVAEDLSAIGMFRGTANGFELDRAPTRSEAAIMLVRLYGAEDTAKADYEAGKITHPFTDVSAFASPYVAWVYTNGISKGTSATTFGSANACSSKMYSAFLLRALGYADGTDFAYADTLAFAQSKGFFDSSALTGTFLRDDLAAITYQALAADLKDGSTYLLDSLVQSGAIDAAAAKPITEKIETYRALVASTADALGNSLDTDVNMTMNMVMNMKGTAEGEAINESETMDMTGKGNVKVILDGTDMQMSLNLDMTAMGETMSTSMWLKDGWMYVQSGEEAYKYEISDVLGSYQALLEQGMAQTTIGMLPFIDSISAKTSGGDTVYTLVMGDAVGRMVDSLLSMVGLEDLGLGMTLGDCSCTYVYTVGSNGALKHADADMTMSMGMNIDAGEEGNMTMDIAYKIAMGMDVKATGKNVKITYPDFSKFEEIDMSYPDLAA